LLFDLQPETEQLLRQAIHERQLGETPVSALRRLALRLLAERHPLSGLRDGSQGFWLIVEASPTLVGRMREVRQELESALARALVDDADAGLDELACQLIAGSVITAFGITHRAAQLRLRAGESSATIYPDLVAQTNRLFDLIEHGAAGVSAPI
jgi:hypothetical protein